MGRARKAKHTGVRPRGAVGLLVAGAVALAASGCQGAVGGSIGLGLEPAARPRPGAEETASVPGHLLRRAPLAAATDPDERFDAVRALSDAREITSFGVRPGGSSAEASAAAYIERRLQQMGYETTVETFALPNGRTSRNVSARRAGFASRRSVVLGAHFDTKPPSPGGNDNASGCGVVLELARLLADNPAAGEVRFVFFGTEEFLVDAPGDNHHLGSRYDAAELSRAQVDNTAAMISVDMVGYGSKFHVRTMRRGEQTLADDLLAEARRTGVGLTFEQDRGPTGWSDHEPYELRGIPAAWLQWQDDPAYHTPADDADHIAATPMRVTGDFLLAWLRGLDPAALERFCDR
jgi:hypothetical protein